MFFSDVKERIIRLIGLIINFLDTLMEGEGTYYKLAEKNFKQSIIPPKINSESGH